MDFQLDEQRQMLANTLSRFIADRCGLAGRDAATRSPLGYDAENWRVFTELGVVGALFEEAAGGFGGDGVDIMTVFEQLGRGLVAEPFLDALMAGRVLASAGTRPDLLAELIAGTRLVTFAHAEAEARYALPQVRTRVVRVDGGWQLDGVKVVVGYAGAADVLLVSARTSGDVAGEQGISLFLVPGDAAGVRIADYANIDGGRSGEVTLSGVRVPGEALIGPEGGAYPLIEAAAGAGVLALSAEALGAMEVAKDLTLDYLRTREQFGAPIGRFQALQHRMATLLVEIEQVRSSVINAAASFAADRLTRERALSAAKITVGHVGIRLAEEAIQMHGGIGMTWELPLSHYAKRLVLIDHQLGDEDHHLERYVALGRQLDGQAAL